MQMKVCNGVHRVMTVQGSKKTRNGGSRESLDSASDPYRYFQVSPGWGLRGSVSVSVTPTLPTDPRLLEHTYQGLILMPCM